MGKLYKLEHATTELSPARERLKALLEQKTACEKRREALRIAQTRLVDPTAEAEAAATELARFDHENAEALSRWAKNGIKKDERPVVDTDRRQALIIAKQTAAENAQAARSASGQLGAEIHAEDLALKSLQVPIETAIAEIISESVDPLIADLQEAMRGVFQQQSRIKRAVETVINLAHTAGPVDTMKAAFDSAQRLSERVHTATVPTVDNVAADMAIWTSFAARLRGDAAAELED